MDTSVALYLSFKRIILHMKKSLSDDPRYHESLTRTKLGIVALMIIGYTVGKFLL